MDPIYFLQEQMDGLQPNYLSLLYVRQLVKQVIPYVCTGIILRSLPAGLADRGMDLTDSKIPAQIRK